MASRWMTFGEAGELKRFGKAQSRWWKQRYNLGRYPGKEEVIEALKRHTRAKEMYGEENIISAVITADRHNAHLLIFVPLTKRIMMGDQKKMRAGRKKAIPQLAKFARLGGESTI